MTQLSVVTPTLNAARWLAECCDSVQRQTGAGRIQHVIVDDGSTDSTRQISNVFGCTFVEGPRQGLYAALNVGLDVAEGDLLVVLGADDLLLPGAAAVATEAVRSTGRRWAVGSLQWIDAAGRDLGTIAAPPAWLTPTSLAALGWSLVHTQCAFLTASLWRDVRPFNTEMTSAADYELLIRALALSPFARVSRPLAAFRRHGENTSKSASALAESASLRRRYAPRTGQRLLLALLMKVYVNARNPRWALHKYGRD